MYTNLVLAAGGIKGFGIIGCLSTLNKYKILEYKKLKKIAGSSVGSLIGLMITLKYNLDEIEELAIKLPFDKFKKFDINNFFDKYGVDDGEEFMNIFRVIIKKKLGKENISFSELYKFNNIEYIVVGTCVSDYTTSIFNYKNSPNMSILDAIRISISVPLVFDVVNYENKIYIDGAISNPYPINIFKNEIDKTLGLLMSTRDKIYEINSIETYINKIINCMMHNISQRDLDIYYKNTLFIEGLDHISPVAFDLRVQEKKEIINLGKVSAEKFINRFILRNLIRKYFIIFKNQKNDIQHNN